MKTRIFLASTLLLFMISFAVVVNLSDDSSRPTSAANTDFFVALIFENNIRSLFHILGFAIITWLVGHQPRPTKIRWVIGFVTAGGVLLEVSQYLSSRNGIATAQLVDSAFDMIANHFGAYLALTWLAWRSPDRHQLSSSDTI